MSIRSFNDGGTSPAATNIYFVTKNSSKVDSNTMILYNDAISLNQPTTINGNLNVTGALTVNNIPVISSLASAGLTPTQHSPNTKSIKADRGSGGRK